MINPKATDDGMIYYGDSGRNVYSIYGIDAHNYLRIHQGLAERGLIVKTPNASTQINFALYSNELLKLEFDLSTLIAEFNSAQQDEHESSHALSLTKICYHYQKAGFEIDVIRTKKRQSTPDLLINGISCDLKVRHDQLDRKMRQFRHLLTSGEGQEYHDKYFKNIHSLHEDLIYALENRTSKQAECLIFNLSDHFHTWNYHRIKSYLDNKTINGISRNPLQPIPGSSIIFLPDNAVDRNRIEFDQKAFWGYVFYDSQKREIVHPENSS